MNSSTLPRRIPAIANRGDDGSIDRLLLVSGSVSARATGRPFGRAAWIGVALRRRVDISAPLLGAFKDEQRLSVVADDGQSPVPFTAAFGEDVDRLDVRDAPHQVRSILLRAPEHQLSAFARSVIDGAEKAIACHLDLRADGRIEMTG